jgi:hypothetical protein
MLASTPDLKILKSPKEIFQVLDFTGWNVLARKAVVVGWKAARKRQIPAGI